MIELWTRPWAFLDPGVGLRLTVADGVVHVPGAHRGALWVHIHGAQYDEMPERSRGLHHLPSFSQKGMSRLLGQLPFPLRSYAPLRLAAGATDITVAWPDLPERPIPGIEPATDAEARGHALMQRARAVWARLHDVDMALADPLNLWSTLRRRWTDPSASGEPTMDIIVRQATQLAASLDALESAPRRTLRRSHGQIPLARASEIDRRSMTWLVRQPGETIAERGGDRQRILAVVREESLDTLENRVVRSYCELAHHTARDYVARFSSYRGRSQRVLDVETFGRRCRRLALTLASSDVRCAPTGAVPNFVLQHNPQYHAVWAAWRDLLRRQQVDDDLWRWQARSFEEFCALAVAVALAGVAGAERIAAAPLRFRSEQVDGSWISHDNPLAVFHLRNRGLVVELWHRMQKLEQERANFAAPLWIRVGQIGEEGQALRQIPVWPIWDADGGLKAGEAEGLELLLRTRVRGRYARALVIRPTDPKGLCLADTSGSVLALTLGTEGTGLADGLAALCDFLTVGIDGERAP